METGLDGALTSGTNTNSRTHLIGDSRDPEAGNWPSQRRTTPLRFATFNVRVDHTDDLDTIHDWSLRRQPVAACISGLCADIVALQEPSPAQAQCLEADLGPEWGVAVAACDPGAWAAAGDDGPGDGQARDGNGVAWRRDRLELLETSVFWLCPAPESPATEPAWGGSKYQRTCHVSRFLDLKSGLRIALYSAHFDHEGADSYAKGGSEVRRMSAALVMGRALAAARSADVDVVVVAGDFNTFEDREGATYAALMESADGEFRDVRDAPGVLEVDCGRGSASWEGWDTNEYCRARAGPQRYDQIFVSAHVPVMRTCVPEERYVVQHAGLVHWAYASDHLPVVADLALPAFLGAPRSRPKPAPASAFAAGGGPRSGSKSGSGAVSPRALFCMVLLSLLIAGAVALLLALLWDMTGGTDLECILECRNRRTDPPFYNASFCKKP